MLTRPLAQSLLFAGCLAVPGLAHALAGFSSTAHTAQKAYDDWTCEYATWGSNDDECHQIAVERGLMQGVYLSWFIDPYMNFNDCYICYRENGYLLGPEEKDLVFTYPQGNTLPTTVAQATAFSEYELVNHVLTCSSSNNGVCVSKWDNDGEIGAIPMRTSCDPADSEMFTRIPGGSGFRGVLRGGIAGWDVDGSYGTNVYLPNQDQSRKNAFDANWQRLSGIPYNLAGYSRHHEASMCSEAGADVFGLQYPYAHNVNLSWDRVNSTKLAALNAVFERCMDLIDGDDVIHGFMRGIICADRATMCARVANEAINAFLDEPWRGDTEPVTRAITLADGVTSPPTLFCALKGTCPQTLVGPAGDPGFEAAGE